MTILKAIELRLMLFAAFASACTAASFIGTLTFMGATSPIHSAMPTGLA